MTTHGSIFVLFFFNIIEGLKLSEFNLTCECQSSLCLVCWNVATPSKFVLFVFLSSTLFTFFFQLKLVLWEWLVFYFLSTRCPWSFPFALFLHCTTWSHVMGRSFCGWLKFFFFCPWKKYTSTCVHLCQFVVVFFLLPSTSTSHANPW